MTRAALFSVVALSLYAADAAAQSKFTKLKNEPAIRNRIEYRNDRVEVAPAVGGTLNGQLRQQVYGSLRVKYHLSDLFAVGISGFGGISFANQTFKGIIEVQDRNQDGVADLPGGEADLAASDDEIFDNLRRVREVPFGAALEGEFTPLYGKISAFGKIFAHYDLSLTLGVGALRTQGIIAEVSPDEDRDALDPRFVPAPHLGVQMRFYVSDMIAINAEFRDTLLIDNLDGGLANGQPDTNVNNFFTGSLGASIFFPSVAALSK